MALDGITIKCIVNELSQKIIGGKIDKINQAENDEILLSIRNNSNKYKLLISANSSNPRVYLCDEYKKENPLKAPTFLMILRKHLGSGKITDIYQHNLDRVLLIEIESYNELRQLSTKLLSVEVMGKHSNIILIEKETNKIIDSIKRVPLSISSVREVLPQRNFVFPPAQEKLSPLDKITLEEFINLIRKKNQIIFKALYTSFEGLSPILAKEICFMANITDSLNTFDLNDIQIERLHNSFERTFKKISDNIFMPCIAYDNEDKVIDFSCIPLSIYENNKIIFNESISNICEKYFLEKDLKERIKQRIYDLKKSVQTKLDRLITKQEKQSQEINDAKKLEEFAKIGDLLKANIYAIEKGMEKIVVQNYFDENYAEIEIKLDPNLNPSENIQYYFKKYNKSKSRIKELSNQLESTKDEIKYLENVIFSIDNINTIEEIDEIKQEMQKEGYYKYVSSKKKQQNSASSPMEFISDDGITIFVGKNNTQNDYLTFKVANSTDVWLHVKNMPGSHVIIKKSLSETPDHTLYQAALLAGYYSKSNLNSKIEIDYTERKNVKKPNGAKAGMVVYETYNTINISPDEKNMPKKIED